MSGIGYVFKCDGRWQDCPGKCGASKTVSTAGIDDAVVPLGHLDAHFDGVGLIVGLPIRALDTAFGNAMRLE